MKTSRKDQNAIMRLLSEEFDFDIPYDDSTDSVVGFGDLPEKEVVIELEPESELEPVADEDDDMYSSLKGDLKKLSEFSSRLQSVCKPNCGLEPWMVAKLSKAADYVSDVYFQLDGTADFANTGFEQAGPEQNL